MNYLPSLAFALILASAALQAVFLLRKSARRESISHWLLLGAAAALAAAILRRSFAIEFPRTHGHLRIARILRLRALRPGLGLQASETLRIPALRPIRRLDRGRGPPRRGELAHRPPRDLGPDTGPQIGLARNPRRAELHRRILLRRLLRRSPRLPLRKGRGEKGRVRQADLQLHRDRLPRLHRGGPRFRRDLGGAGLGLLVVLGSEGDMGLGHLARIYGIPSPSADAEKEGCPALYRRGPGLPLRGLHFFRGQLSLAGAPRLRPMKAAGR